MKRKEQGSRRVLARVLAKDLSAEDLRQALGSTVALEEGGCCCCTTTTSCSCDCSCDDCDCCGGGVE